MSEPRTEAGRALVAQYGVRLDSSFAASVRAIEEQATVEAKITQLGRAAGRCVEHGAIAESYDDGEVQCLYCCQVETSCACRMSIADVPQDKR